MQVIRFLAEYDDGSTEPFDVPLEKVDRGDHVAKIIARERQDPTTFIPILAKAFNEVGHVYYLKAGHIVRVFRDPAICYFRRKR